ncbi:MULTISPECIES: TRAP transporter large permease [unclassified Pseudomonas]|uniref:TRAP transporter large permease n=1 Tax=unclassified Pseudomonas TaxID=196821 RepID=UPI0002A1D9E7|nr:MULTISPECIES: TRAP transporter large permease [unclassified Pseudomonas]MBB1609237.1 C4-dicarboxylate ABC transporter permease [Pseudomonas sp. UMC76]MBB1636945.1 C4-dicarboxylate ABC transporter permease [Pseudomonas sp. UME83]NTX89800.1 TRAP transporter large permease [Pseudomonas sp. UMA643]NTY17650.1 TRAP transporter large permease [Pseudomonas sp. UMC3103]NTY23220.1 TRAP transporter large permease [Pseudomonas sp. UMA603]
MSAMALGLWMFAGLLAMLVLRVQVGVAMFLAGALCFLVINQGDLSALLYTLNNLAYARLSNYDLAVIPLFVLMGQFATHGGLSKALFRCASAFIGHWRGGLALSAVGACAGFGAICGSSLATAATMGQVALPELARHKYSGRLATASVAAGGTLGILIPPSVPLIIYAVLTQESIAKLFVAAMLPALVAVIGYMLVIRIQVARDPNACQPAPKASGRERLAAFVQILPILAIFLVVIVGIYGGWANPTEAASIGAAACGLLAVLRGGMRWDGLGKSLTGTAEASAMIFLVLLGADLLNSGLALTQMPVELATWVRDSGLAPLLVLAVILLIYLLLGCVMDSLAMILLTIPIFYPMIMGLEFFDLTAGEKSIWFGILALMVVEIGLIHPPLGMNLFIVNKLAKDVPYMETARGVLPFLASDLLRIVLLVLVPGLSLWLLSF